MYRQGPHRTRRAVKVSPTGRLDRRCRRARRAKRSTTPEGTGVLRHFCFARASRGRGGQHGPFCRRWRKSFGAQVVEHGVGKPQAPNQPSVERNAVNVLRRPAERTNTGPPGSSANQLQTRILRCTTKESAACGSDANRSGPASFVHDPKQSKGGRPGGLRPPPRQGPYAGGTQKGGELGSGAVGARHPGGARRTNRRGRRTFIALGATS